MPRLVSVWALMALALLQALQAIVGDFVTILLGALLSGVLLNVFLIALFCEALVRRVPRVLMAIAVLAYGAYYVLYAHQALEIADKAAELRASNPGLVLQFDPEQHALLTKDAHSFVTLHALPVAYEANDNFKPENHLAFRLIRRDQCSSLTKDTQSQIVTFGMHFQNKFRQDICVLRYPEAPQHKTITAVTKDDMEIWKRKREISEATTELYLDGKMIGSYRTAGVWRLSVIPFVVMGCGSNNSERAQQCFADFWRDRHIMIDATPNGVDPALYDTPLSVMLGIKKYTAADLEIFQGYEDTTAALARLRGVPRKIEDDIYKTLDAILTGANPVPTFNMGYALAQNSARLAPYAEAMVRRLAELNDYAKVTPRRDEQMGALATALAALPPEAFAPVSAAVFDVLRTLPKGRLPALYVRAADAPGDGTLAFYTTEFMNDHITGYLRVLPVLAICRIGRADEAVIAKLKQRFVDAKDSGGFFEYQSALAVALAKLGQEDFLRANTDAIPWRGLGRGWMAALLDGQGRTATGPNNCMMEGWGSTDYLPRVMQPALERQRDNKWSARSGT